MKRKKLYAAAALSGIVVSIVLILLFWSQLPDRIPSHYSLSGEPDMYAGKWIVWLGPAVSILIYVLMGLTIKNPGMVRNYPYAITPQNREAHYIVIREMARWLRAGIIWTFTYTEWLIVADMFRTCPAVGFTIILLIAVIISVTILFMRKGKKIQ